MNEIEMSAWRSRIQQFRRVSLQHDFLDARIHNEEIARDILNTRAGEFSEDDFLEFLKVCNTEVVPPDAHSERLRDRETCTRFQLSFIGQNRNLMLATLEECNEGIGRLWHSSDANVYQSLTQFWRNKRIKGAGSGLPTMILYLKDPNKYNVWIPFLSQALGIFAGRPFATNPNVANYVQYNDFINRSFRKVLVNEELMPQEIDYILYRIGRCATSAQEGGTNKIGGCG